MPEIQNMINIQRSITTSKTVHEVDNAMHRIELQRVISRDRHPLGRIPLLIEQSLIDLEVYGNERKTLIQRAQYLQTK